MEQKPVSIIVFGATGDLMKRKLVPAFGRLFASGVLAKESVIVGVGRKDFTDASFKDFLTKRLEIFYLQNGIHKVIPVVTQNLAAGLRESALKSTTAGFTNASVLYSIRRCL